jgi:hypothetical protein
MQLYVTDVPRRKYSNSRLAADQQLNVTLMLMMYVPYCTWTSHLTVYQAQNR